MPSNPNIKLRKSKHLQICADEKNNIESSVSTGLERVWFVPNALPEIDSKAIDTQVEWLNYSLSFPFLISPMTGGSDNGYQVNQDLARIAQEHKVAVGMGSMRVLFRHPEVISHFQLKKIAPDVPLLANLGGAQLKQYQPPQIIEVVKKIEADALSIHLNCGQELYQSDGDHDFTSIKKGIADLAASAPFPLIVKETGFGIDPSTARWLLSNGVQYIDVAGAGGTNWIEVELLSNPKSPTYYNSKGIFNNWGIPTGYALAALSHYPNRIIASGGIRSGLDIAKSIALGAFMTASALPIIRTLVARGAEGVSAYLNELQQSLRTVMTLTSCASILDLRDQSLIMDSYFVNQVAQINAHHNHVN